MILQVNIWVAFFATLATFVYKHLLVWRQGGSIDALDYSLNVSVTDSNTTL